MIHLKVFASNLFSRLLSNLCAEIFCLISEELKERLFLKDMKDSLEILLDMAPFPHICFKHFLLQFPFPTIICDIGIVNKITLLEKLTKYKGFCCHGPFSTSVDLIFPFFQKFVENCFCILYLAFVT